MNDCLFSCGGLGAVAIVLLRKNNTIAPIALAVLKIIAFAYTYNTIHLVFADSFDHWQRACISSETDGKFAKQVPS